MALQKDGSSTAQSGGQAEALSRPKELDLALALLSRDSVDTALESSGGIRV